VETLAEDEVSEFKRIVTLANMDANEHFAKNLAEKI